MRAMVTGAAGFLGRHISRGFRDAGFEVYGFDLKPADLPGISVIEGDLLDQAALGAVIDGVDVVAHVGAIGDVYLAGEDPSLAASVNVVGTSNVVQAAVATGARVVYASTWEVYGEPHYEPLTEEHPTAPDHPYNITKLAGEELLLAATSLQGLEGVALRLGTAYGSGLRPNSVFRIFLDKARERLPITIQGDGSQARQFTHASDIAYAFVAAAKSDLSGLAMNIVSPEMVTIKELAERITDRYPTELKFGPPRPGDVPSAAVSSDLAKDKLGWVAETSFDIGLDEFIAGASEST